jgi:2',3'-cyclic-nucleotide 2'-phosphodiesterase (5'-nucleotidase family)
VAKEISEKLKYEEKVDLLIALTHNLLPNDVELYKEAPLIDFNFGGHDHGKNNYKKKIIITMKKKKFSKAGKILKIFQL